MGRPIDGRPNPCARIYKHGRLKTRKEMEEDGTLDQVALDNMPDTVKDKSFNELVSESKPIPKDLVGDIKELTDGVEINLEEKLNPDDE